MHTYQPLSGLHDPLIVDVTAANLSGLRVDVFCVPGSYVGGLESRGLCRRLRVLFENQGAVVETYAEPRRSLDLGGGGGAVGQDGAPVGPADLVVEVRSRLTNRSSHPLSWGLFSLTFGVLPGVTEQSFAQDVTVRDDAGYLLVQRSLEGRIVRYVGFGSWAGNKVLDWLVRPPEEELTGDRANRDLSADLYGQLSQSVFDAKLHWEVQKAATAQGTP